MGKWTLKQVTSDSGEKFHELRCDGVIAMLLPRGCVQMGWEGGGLKRFLGILNAHDGLVKALKEIVVSPMMHDRMINPNSQGMGDCDGRTTCAIIAEEALDREKCLKDCFTT